MTAKPTTIVEQRRALDEALARTASGDTDALHTLFEMTSAKIFGVVLRIVPERDVAEDIVQEVYIRVWRRAGRFDRDKGSPIAWLCAIARNCALDELRRRPRVAAAPDSDIESVVDRSPRADQSLCDQEDLDRLHHCLDELAHNHRRSIVMSFFGGLSHSRLSERLGEPLGTVKSWIRRGLTQLRDCLGYE